MFSQLHAAPIPEEKAARRGGAGRLRGFLLFSAGAAVVMNGVANPLLDKEEHPLQLGESFERHPKASFHTIRCECPGRGGAYGPGRRPQNIGLIKLAWPRVKRGP